MEPVTVGIVAAIVAAATTAAKDLTSQAIKDAYGAVKQLIIDRYKKSEPLVKSIEVNPSSKDEQSALAKQLAEAGAAQDGELRAKVQALLDAIATLRKEPQAAALFDFDQLHAARNFELDNIDALQTVLRVRGTARFEGDFRATNISQHPDGNREKK